MTEKDNAVAPGTTQADHIDASERQSVRNKNKSRQRWSAPSVVPYRLYNIILGKGQYCAFFHWRSNPQICPFRSIICDNIARMNQGNSWQVMATHEIQFAGEVGKVEVIQLTNGTPEFFFFVHFPSRDILLSRFGVRPELWNGTSLRLAEAKALGEFIEQQIGYTLPPKACNNPFHYKGDIQIKLERFRFNELFIERAKAPYNTDVYYRIIFSEDRKVTLIKMAFLGESHWTYDDEVTLDGKDFELFKSLLLHFEEAYQLGIYTSSL